MSNQLAVREFSYDEIERSALAMAKSGYFMEAREQNQAIVKILAGREMGFGPFASMTGVYIIQGRPSIGANLMASAVKRSGRYDYRVNKMDDTVCEVEYFQRGQSIGVSRFTIEDARKAGTKNIDKFPRNMLFARAMSNGVRWYCPDVFDGAAVYTPEELGADVNEAGDVIDAQVIPPAQPAPTLNKPASVPVPQTAPAIAAQVTGEPQEAPAVADEWPAETLQYFVDEYKLRARSQAANMLNLSGFSKLTPLPMLKHWVTLYKQYRAEGSKTPQEAAKEACDFIDAQIDGRTELG